MLLNGRDFLKITFTNDDDDNDDEKEDEQPSKKKKKKREENRFLPHLSHFKKQIHVANAMDYV